MRGVQRCARPTFSIAVNVPSTAQPFPELLRALADKFRMQPHLALALLAALTASSSVPQVESSASYPKRSSADSALLE